MKSYRKQMNKLLITKTFNIVNYAFDKAMPTDLSNKLGDMILLNKPAMKLIEDDNISIKSIEKVEETNLDDLESVDYKLDTSKIKEDKEQLINISDIQTERDLQRDDNEIEQFENDLNDINDIETIYETLLNLDKLLEKTEDTNKERINTIIENYETKQDKVLLNSIKVLKDNEPFNILNNNELNNHLSNVKYYVDNLLSDDDEIKEFEAMSKMKVKDVKTMIEEYNKWKDKQEIMNKNKKAFMKKYHLELNKDVNIDMYNKIEETINIVDDIEDDKERDETSKKIYEYIKSYENEESKYITKEKYKLLKRMNGYLREDNVDNFIKGKYRSLSNRFKKLERSVKGKPIKERRIIYNNIKQLHDDIKKGMIIRKE